MPLLQFKVHADYDEVMRLRGEIEKLEDTLKNFGPGTTESTIKSIQNQLIEARKRFSELIQEAAKAGAEVEQSIRNSLQKTKDKGNINITVKADTSDFHKKNEKLLRDVDKSLRELETYGEKASSTLQSVSQMAGLTLAGMGFIEFADKIKEVRGEFQQYEVAFKTMLGSAEKAQDLMQQLTKTAAITPFDLQGVTQGAKQLLAYGISADEVNQKLIQLGDIAAGLSLPLGDLVYLYGTTMAQGRMFTQDLRQFMGRGIPLAAELAKQFGVAESKVGELVTAGKVTAKEFNAAIESMSAAGGQFGGLMEAQSQTILGQISNIGDAIDSMFNDLGKSSEGVINTTLSGVAYMVEHYEQFGRVLMGVVATYGTYKTALMLVTAAKGWAKIDRRILDWRWAKKPDMFALLVYIILRAQWQDGYVDGVLIKRGQFMTSLQTLADKTGITVNKLRNDLKRLQSTGIITIKTTNKYRIITLCDYDEYQCRDDYEPQAKPQAKSQTNPQAKPQAKPQQIIRIEEDEEIKDYEYILNSIVTHFFEDGSNAKRLLMEAASEWGVNDEVVGRFIELGIDNMKYRNDCALCDNKGVIIRDVRAALLAFAKRHNNNYRPNFENVLVYAGEKGISKDIAKKWYVEMEDKEWKNYQGKPIKNWQRSLTRYIESHNS